MTDSLSTAAPGVLSDFALWRSIGALLLVLALMVAALYFLRRLQRGASKVRGGGRLDLEILGQMALAPKQFVSVVRVGEKQWVLGVTEQSIQYLGEYEGAPPEQASPTKGKTTFASTLERAVGRFGHALARTRVRVEPS